MKSETWLVTACQNRNDDLVRVIPSWLSLPVDVILISDFGSNEPVGDTLSRQGIISDRIKIVRTNDAERWILSWAYNEVLLMIPPSVNVVKIDCDDEATPKLAHSLHGMLEITSGSDVIYGNWRNQHLANIGKLYPSSGFFIAKSGAINLVGGFNPCILTYGWDDIDLYQRLANSGFRLIDAPPSILYSAPHDRIKSFSNQIGDAAFHQLEIDSGSLGTRELSNIFSRCIAQLTYSIPPVNILGLPWHERLVVIGKRLLSCGFSLENIYRYAFDGKVSFHAFLSFYAASPYCNAVEYVKRL